MKPIKTNKVDNNGQEIQINDRVKVSVGFDFQAAGIVTIKNGGIFIDWESERPTGCDSDMLYSYGDVEVISKDIVVLIHASLELGDNPTEGNETS